jgi:hypothetical protein
MDVELESIFERCADLFEAHQGSAERDELLDEIIGQVRSLDPGRA